MIQHFQDNHLSLQCYSNSLVKARLSYGLLVVLLKRVQRKLLYLSMHLLDVVLRLDAFERVYHPVHHGLYLARVLLAELFCLCLDVLLYSRAIAKHVVFILEHQHVHQRAVQVLFLDIALDSPAVRRNFRKDSLQQWV